MTTKATSPISQVRTLLADLRARGVTVAEPNDPFQSRLDPGNRRHVHDRAHNGWLSDDRASPDPEGQAKRSASASPHRHCSTAEGLRARVDPRIARSPASQGAISADRGVGDLPPKREPSLATTEGHRRRRLASRSRIRKRRRMRPGDADCDSSPPARQRRARTTSARGGGTLWAPPWPRGPSPRNGN